MSQFEQLKKLTVIVADTGDLNEIKKYKPQDATTNPSLVLKALNKLKSNDNNEVKNDKDNGDEYNELINLAITYAKNKCKDSKNKTIDDMLPIAIDRLAVEFGIRILKEIDGVVSTELDARLSYDVDASVARAIGLIKMYEELGVKNARESRVLIKVATTWEGIKIAKILNEKHNIRCNMTLLFSIWQAVAAAQIANAYLISPFVGRIYDWYKKETGTKEYDAYKDDPGVKSVRNIYGYYKLTNAKTIVMGASFRNKDQVLALAGCDRLTIGPKFLKELKDSKDKVKQYLSKDKYETKFKKKISITESKFRYGMCQDAMATEKLAEGIRKFAADIVKLEDILRKAFEKSMSDDKDKDKDKGNNDKTTDAE